ncbi:RNA polymerase sigma factor [Ulvibacterium sp.]|uniref:RNA polymerase sigma factor n=1 Tax=Ulvibacterium sp. TaxID=2665914 RepID=UPI003BAB8B27
MKKYLDNDAVLMRDLKNDGVEAYARIVDKYYDSLYRYALNLSKDSSMAEDIVQEVYMNIWESRQRLNMDIPLNKLLYKSIYHKFLKLYKKNKAVGILEQKYFQTVGSLMEEYDTSDMEEKLTLLREAIEHLPPKCKKVFLLSKREGLTHKEISQYLDISVNTIENHIAKAFSILREKVQTVSKGILFFLFRKIKP